MILKQLKYFLLFVLTFLLGAQPTYAKMEINQYYGLSNESRIIVANGDNVVVELIDQTIGNTYPQFQIATATYDEAAEYIYITLSQSKEYQYTSIQTTDHKMFELEGVPYKTTSSDPVQFGGDIEIIRTADDHVYWRIVNAGVDEIALINRMDDLGHMNIKNWLQNEAITPQMRNTLDNWANAPPSSTSKIAGFDIDLADVNFKNYITSNQNQLEEWEILFNHSKLNLRKEAASLNALNKVKDNSKVALYGITDDLLATIRGSSYKGYALVLDDLELLITTLPVPSKVHNLEAYLGSQGFGMSGSANNTLRHSAVQLERLLDNSFIVSNADEIHFERQINHGYGNSVSDVHIKYNGGVIEIETKAGIMFFSNVNNNNFPKQCFNSLQEVNKLENYKVFSDSPTKYQYVN